MNPRLNNFDLIRLIAALQVVFVHAVGHTEVLDNGPGWLLRMLDMAVLYPGVAVFFVISGFLISKSWERSRDRPAAYFWRRGLRIYPGLVACVVVSLLALGFLGFLDQEALGSGGFWAWLVGQLSFGQFYNPECFREFGVGVVNGALWTISVELQFYVLLPVLYRLAYPVKGPALGRRWILPATFIASFVVFLWVDARTNGPGGFGNAGIVPKVLFVSFAPHWWMFALGIALHRHFDRVRKLIEGRALVFLIAYTAIAFSRVHLLGREGEAAWLFYLGYLPERILLAALTLSAAFTARGLSSRVLGGTDISYGVYIYHFLLINILIELGVMTTAGWVGVVFALSLTAGMLSWFLIEKRALALKSRIPVARSTSAPQVGQPEW
ncbi:acyltransferase family protein [Haloferula sp. A504]|uniref:acyltransferase family protein n=1 Tax=Haloferula sp. A504 TaxID=3373601 RepID=UPI0031C3271A|nr:acyltransferase [Verrucomicrobiaceae bacterium E54]